MSEIRSEKNDEIQHVRNDEILLVFSVDVYYDQGSIEPYKLNNVDLLPDISSTINRIISPHGAPKITWLISDDENVIRKFTSVKEKTVNHDDEIGLHCLISKVYDLDIASEQQIDDYLTKSLDLFRNYEINPRSVRIAGCASNNKMISVLAKHGILVDSSAVPKRKREVPIKFNWENSDSKPYYPSMADYRIAHPDLTMCHQILEVPITTMMTKTKYDKEPLLRYFDLTFRTEVILKGIDNIVRSNNIIVSIIHPMQLLDFENKNELYCNGIKEFEKNLKCLVEKCLQYNKKIKCISLTDCLGFFKSN